MAGQGLDMPQPDSGARSALVCKHGMCCDQRASRGAAVPQRLHVQGLTSCARARMSCKGQKAVQGVRPGVRVPMVAHKHWCAKAGQGTQDKC